MVKVVLYTKNGSSFENNKAQRRRLVKLGLLAFGLLLAACQVYTTKLLAQHHAAFLEVNRGAGEASSTSSEKPSDTPPLPSSSTSASLRANGANIAVPKAFPSTTITTSKLKQPSATASSSSIHNQVSATDTNSAEPESPIPANIQAIINKALLESSSTSKNGDNESGLSLDEQERRALLESTKADPNLNTIGLLPKGFYSGFRNQAMAFFSFVMYAKDNNYSQILLPTIQWKDLFGTNKPTPHEVLFDVPHWNSFYPILPRFVAYHPSFVDYNNATRKWTHPESAERNATHPFVYGRQGRLVNQYRQYTKRVWAANETRHEAEIAMLASAFRPHPAMQRHINQLHGSMEIDHTDGKYMCLHARIEPDMQRHTFCPDKKVKNLKQIFSFLEQKFPEPPVSKVFIAVNRPILEAEGLDPNSTNPLAVENLAELNRAGREGLWGGRVKVYEGGTPSLVNHSIYSKYPSISGSVVNYFLAVDADYFIGTEVSSFSTDVIAARFFHNAKNNWWYLPHGLELATPPEAKVPPRFQC